MIPAGIDRDKRIAELRRDRCQYYSPIAIEFQGDAPACQRGSVCFPDACNTEAENPDSYCLEYSYKPYSTDITAAMELELPWNRFVEVTHKFSKGFFVEIWHKDELYCEGMIHKNESIAKSDARSGAWLKQEEA